MVISITEAKATLSMQVRKVRDGQVITITDRGHAVAMLIPIPGDNNDDANLHDLERDGLIKRAKIPFDDSFWDLPMGEDPSNSVRRAVIEDREDRS